MNAPLPPSVTAEATSAASAGPATETAILLDEPAPKVWYRRAIVWAGTALVALAAAGGWYWQAQEKANGQKNVLSAVVNEIKNVAEEINASRPEVIVPIRDASGRIIGGKVQTAGGEVREIRIQ